MKRQVSTCLLPFARLVETRNGATAKVGKRLLRRVLSAGDLEPENLYLFQLYLD